MEAPKSLTAIVHVKFHYEDNRSTEPRRVELLSKMLEHAADLKPELQQMLLDFASHMHKVSSEPGNGGQSPE